MESCPGLHGNEAKPRFVIIISPDEQINSTDRVLVIPTSSSSLSAYKIPLPNRGQYPNCKSGLPQPCDAVCDEPKLIPVADLIDYRGCLTNATFVKVCKRMREYLICVGKLPPVEDSSK